MADKLRFDGRVVLVTGAGGGLGREYALAFASRGASVVVNDLGGDTKGGGKSSSAADKVVQEIRSLGGKAVADYNSVEDGDKVVQTALDAFGRIDILINNAGILRDKSFGRTSDQDWDLVHRVHLRGSFKVTRAAWPHMREQRYGKIIMTSSHSSLGNFGQANYSAAKMGLIGLSNTLSVEGAKYNVVCNAIVPVAGSRMTNGILPAEVFELLKPEFIAPFVVYLCHESCQENGGIFEMAGGWAAQMRWQESAGAMLRKGGAPVTPEMVRNNWGQITDWSGPVKVKTKEGNMSDIMSRLQEADVTPDSTEGKLPKVEESHFTFEAKNVILYALGVGVTVQEDASHLKFLYEGSDDFSTLPTFGVVPALAALNSVVMNAVEKAGLPFNPAKLLHGEQYLELYKPLPTSGTLTTKGEVVDILDKGKGVIVLINVTSYDSSGEAVCFNQSSIYIGGAGGFGGKKRSEHNKLLVATPTRAPDASIKEKTSCCQAAIYRLSGDLNPIHIDPDFAKMGGFSSPILHGLCSFGYAARHVLKQYANNDVSKFKAIKARFSKPVYPGQTIQTDMWRDGNRISFQCTAVESGQVVLSGAYVDLKDVATSKKTIPSPQDVDALLSSRGKSGLKSEILFNEISKRVKDHPDLVKKVKGIFEWSITKGGKTAGQWTVDLKTGAGSVTEGPCKQGKPDCRITVDDDDLASLATGKANPQQLFMKGKLKVKGNIMLTAKLAQLFKDQAKM